MKKFVIKTYVFTVTIALFLSIFTSCNAEKEYSNTTEPIIVKYATYDEIDAVKFHSPTYVADDSKTLEESLTVEYDINELEEFFKNRCENDIITYSKNQLNIDEVDKRFPLEIIRSKGYSVYKVKQGGYFYVFWINCMDPKDPTIYYEPSVYFTAYISSSLDENLFNSISPNISTAQDVYEIDPEFELNFNASSAIFSYSFLNDTSVVEVIYYSKRKNDTYEGIVVKEISIIDRESASSYFSRISSKDLPQL